MVSLSPIGRWPVHVYNFTSDTALHNALTDADSEVNHSCDRGTIMIMYCTMRKVIINWAPEVSDVMTRYWL